MLVANAGDQVSLVDCCSCTAAKAELLEAVENYKCTVREEE